MQSLPTQARFAHSLASTRRRVQLCIIVYPISGESFPQCHQIVLTSPEESLFFHWTYRCTPFSFMTLVRQMQWDRSQSADDVTALNFEAFGEFIRNRVNECVEDPTRFQAVIKVDRLQKVASLEFTELVHSYRRVDQVILEFTPSTWPEITQDIKSGYIRIKAR
ncbi:hypothetical protein BASA60_007263 [Batrachochytrium salamandrivorans]|nr:hypothetical protein BASA60_007263 [Batrachochytrium salamandrivorans]